MYKAVSSRYAAKGHRVPAMWVSVPMCQAQALEGDRKPKAWELMAGLEQPHGARMGLCLTAGIFGAVVANPTAGRAL